MNVFLWTNCDLDGVASTIILGNAFAKSNFDYQCVFFGDFEKKYTEWFNENSNKYDKIFIVGIPLDQNTINKIDDKKVIIISDKKENIKVYDSTLIDDDTTSCTKLLYKKFKDKFEFSSDLKKLIVYVDDYNSYELKTREAKILNGLFRKSGNNRFYNFVNKFWSGYQELSESELRLSSSFYKDLNSELENLFLYQGEYKGHSVIATFAKGSANEIANSLLDNYDYEIAIIVNVNTQFVSFRKKRNSSADIKFMAENLCNGGGSVNSSGGKLTQKFLDFTTTLIEL
jgi:oligoribonuclease NrnB/cAMP/cGMP phosphodiesterase (DHH superfamily)